MSSPLIDAINGADFERVGELLESGADPNGPAYDHYCTVIPLLEAAKLNLALIVELLLVKGADVNLPDTFGTTALHLAATNGCSELTLLLLRFGANVHAGDYNSSTPLHCAVRYGHRRIVRILLERGADVEARLYTGRQRPLHIAVYKGFSAIVRLLLQFGADMDAEDGCSCTALHAAAILTDLKITTILLEHGCDIFFNFGRVFDCLEVFGNELASSDYYNLYILSLDKPGSTDVHGDAVDIANAIVNHVRKLQVAELPLDIVKPGQCDIRRVRSFLLSEYSDDVEIFSKRKCRDELEQLEESSLGHLTLYNLLMNYRNPYLINNRSIFSTLEAFDFSELPVYGNLLEHGFKLNRARRKLSKAGLKSLKIVVETCLRLQQVPQVLPEELLEMIVSYLDKKDLHSLIACRRDLKLKLSR